MGEPFLVSPARPPERPPLRNRPPAAPLLPVTCALACGIALAPHLPLNRNLLLALTMGCGAGCGFWLLKKQRPRWLEPVWLLAFFALLGNLLLLPHLRPPASPEHIAQLTGPHRIPLTLLGRLASTPETRQQRSRFLLATEGLLRPSGGRFQPARGLVRLTVGGPLPARFTPGDLLLVRATVGPPGGRRLPGAFDNIAHLTRQGIWRTGWVAQPGLVAIVTPNQPRPWLSRLSLLPARMRHQARQTIIAAAPARVRDLYLALLTGDRSRLSRQTLDRFTASGTMHLLAISGTHLGLLALVMISGFTWLLGRWPTLLLRLPARKLAAGMALAVVTSYALITGLAPPTVRSLIMISVFLTAVLLDQQWCSLNNLALAALLILLWQPAGLFTISFQLSFAAALGLILASPQLARIRPAPQAPGSRRLLTWILTGLAVAVVATLATGPLQLAYFNRLNPYGPLATVLVAPLLCFWALPLGLVALTVTPFSAALGHGLFAAGGLGITAAEYATGLFASLPFASCYLPTPTPEELTAAATLLIAFSLRRFSPKAARIAIIASLTVLITVPSLLYLQRQLSNATAVTILDVGQGNAILVELPHGKTVLIDGGNSQGDRFPVGERLIAPFLWHQRLRRLTAVVISHPHADHYNGLGFILQRFRPQTLWINGRPGRGPGYGRLLALARRMGIDIRVPRPGEVLVASGTSSLVNLADLHRQPGRTNDQSLVLKLFTPFGDSLFPGDIEQAGEQRLLNRTSDLRADLLVAPHHGSGGSTSPAFLKRVAPRFMVVSAGGSQAGGFADPRRIRGWQQQGIEVHTTGRDGSLCYRLNAAGPRLLVSPLPSPLATLFTRR